MDSNTTNYDLKLSDDAETEGLDFQAAQSWIYPTNYPIRDYQYNIVQQALLKNTLVSLPTGLGKTFIAAVVMYNYYRWYPHSKIIFMAPTKPLVKQQIDACYNIMAIPQEATVELTGSKVSSSRVDVWMSKRVFFITPQVLQNDLGSVPDLGASIKCLVFDEAHRARGNHAYCEVIRKLFPNNKLFRVLALSATPGGSVEDVQEVMQNLLISHLEFRTEESLDVAQYSFHRSLETVVVPLSDKLQEIKNQYIKILEIYTKPLVTYKVINGNCSTLTKGKIYMTMREYQQKFKGNSSNYGQIMRSLNICVTLYHGYELLIRHGLRNFLSFFEEHISKPLLRGNEHLLRITKEVRDFLGPAPNIEPLPDGTYPEIPPSTKFGHPKYYKLREILLSHFSQANDASRVIVFFEYRESATEALTLLLQAKPLIKPKIFLGQGSGVTQRIQIGVVKAFREGTCNTLLSTCIGEEGLDVGEVDLIVCFDISNKSPIRMVQRMGRTGRKREGKIIVLVTEGKEQQTLKDCLVHKNNIAHFVLNSQELANTAYENSPRMLPADLVPTCEKLYITVKKPVLTKNSTLKNMLRTISSTSSEPMYSQNLIIKDVQDKIPEIEMLWNKPNPLSFDLKSLKTYKNKIEKQRKLQPTYKVKHSKSSELLVRLLQTAESKRFNIPLTQRPGSASQLSQTRNLKQSDIRSMFFKPTKSDDLPQDQVFMTQVETIPEKYTKELFTELASIVSIGTSIPKSCKYCAEAVDCANVNITSDVVDLTTWFVPDISILQGITAQDLRVFAESLMPKSKHILEVNKSLNDMSELFLDEKLDAILNNLEMEQIEQKAKPDEFDGSVFENLNLTQLENCAEITKEIKEKSYSYQPPKNLSLLMEKFSISLVDMPEIPEALEVVPERNQLTPDLFDSIIMEQQTPKKPCFNLEELLEFFKLKSIQDLFVIDNIPDSDSDCTIILSPKSPVFDKKLLNKHISPTAKVSSQKSEEALSPVLYSPGRVAMFKRKIALSQKETPSKPNLKRLNLLTSKIDSPSNFSVNTKKMASTPKVGLDDLDEFCNLADFELNKNDLTVISEKQEEKFEKNTSIDLDISDVCDLSVFGLTVKNDENKGGGSGDNCDNKSDVDLSIDDICDLSAFGISNVNQDKIDLCTKSSPKTLRQPSEEEFSAFIQANSSKVFTKHNNKPAGISPIKRSATQTLPLQNTIKQRNQFDGGGKSSQKSQPVQHSSEDVESFFKNDSINFTAIIEDSSPQVFKQRDNKIAEIIDLTQDESPIKKTATLSPSQLTITQILGIVDKRSSKLQETNSSEKENIQISKKRRLSLNKNITQSSVPPQNNVPVHNKFSFFNSPVSGLNNSDSDEDFEEKPKSQVWIKPKDVKLKKNVGRGPSLQRKNTAQPASSSRKAKLNEFIDDEAKLSDDEVVSEDEEEANMDCFEASFVADEETQIPSTQMHVKYLESTRSPRGRGTFKIPVMPKRNMSYIFSQEDSHVDDTYLNDSFVVNSEVQDETQDLSELDLLELRLKEMRREKKRKKSSEGNEKVTKRRRILRILSDDDSD